MSYDYHTERATYDDGYLLGALLKALPPTPAARGQPVRLFELGCGNGVIAKALAVLK